jgi:dienelactone hydrolase
MRLFTNETFQVVSPDYFNGDAIPEDALMMGPGATFDVKAWRTKHGAAQSRPPLDKVIAALKEQRVTRFGVSGHCFGGKLASLPINLWKKPCCKFTRD